MFKANRYLISSLLILIRGGCMDMEEANRFSKGLRPIDCFTQILNNWASLGIVSICLVHCYPSLVCLPCYTLLLAWSVNE
jgi:hypothetical protein